jgi:hypothetical protein
MPPHGIRWTVRRVRRVSACAAALVVASVAAPAAATVYKCVGARGVPIYQEDPCPAGRELRNFDADPPSLSVVPGPRGGSTHAEPRTRERPPPARVREEPHPGRRDDRARGDAEQRRHAYAGMSETEVLAKLGRPDVTGRGSGKEAARRWTYLPAPGDPHTTTTLWLANGTVTNVERKVTRR